MTVTMTTDDHFGDTLMLCIVSPTYFMNIHTVMTDEYACKLSNTVHFIRNTLNNFSFKLHDVQIKSVKSLLNMR